jgi:hypothetical protein
VCAASIIRAMVVALMMEAARTSETSVDIDFTTRHIPEESELQRDVDGRNSDVNVHDLSECYGNRCL